MRLFLSFFHKGQYDGQVEIHDQMFKYKSLPEGFWNSFPSYSLHCTRCGEVWAKILCEQPSPALYHVHPFQAVSSICPDCPAGRFDSPAGYIPDRLDFPAPLATLRRQVLAAANYYFQVDGGGAIPVLHPHPHHLGASNV